MDAINAVTSECFNALSQLRELDSPMPAAELVHQRLCGYIDGMKDRARESRVSDRDLQEMVYAIAALADEIALSKPALHAFWVSRPLQLKYCNETVAGENFFARVQALRGDPRRQDALRVYYLCLLFGFQGQHGIRGGDLDLMRIVDSLRNDLDRSAEKDGALSPDGEPPDEPIERMPDRNRIIWIPLSIFAVAIAVFVGLRVSLNRQVDALRERVTEVSDSKAEGR